MMSNVYHRAAMCLQELVEEDREWLLEQLPNEDSAQVKDVLNNLTQVRAPGASVGSEGESFARTDERDKAHGEKGDHAAILDAAQADEIAEVLMHEPLGLIACLLTIRNWRWSHDYLAKLVPLQRVRISEKIGNLPGVMPTKAELGLIRVVAGRLTEVRQRRLGAAFTVQSVIDRLRYRSEEELKTS